MAAPLEELILSSEPKQGRIPMLERDELTPELGLLYDKLPNERGIIPNNFKTVAHVPDVNDPRYSKAREFFDAKQIIELSAVAAAFEFFPRFVNAFAIPVTPIPEPVSPKS
jgi:hypothetical protein